MKKFLPNSILWLFLSVCLSAIFFTTVAQAKKANTQEQVWKGAYLYPETKKKPAVNFELIFKKAGTNITGKTIEPNTFGDNGFQKLFAKVKGSLKNDGTISFTKTYDGTAGVSHSVEYKGKFTSPDKIEGTWSIKDFGGAFYLTKEHSASNKLTR